MHHFQPIRTSIRAPRVNLRGAVYATLHLENRRQFSARIHQLSLTGGLLELATCIDERSRVGIAFQLRSAPMIARADVLFPLLGGMGYFQPFRFTGYGAGVRQALEFEIGILLQQMAVPAPPPVPVKAGHGSGLRLPRFFADSF